MGDAFLQKQTLVNAVRYVSQELLDHTEKVAAVEQQLLDRQQQLFREI